MQQGEEGEDCVQQPNQTGWTGQFSVVTGGNPDALAIRFVYFQDTAEGVHATPTEIVATTQAVMELMLAVQEVQRVLGIELPAGTMSLVRAPE